MSDVIFHLTTVSEFQHGLITGAYRPASLGAEGFIHLLDADQVVDVANRTFAGRTDLVIVSVDADRLEAELRYEGVEGGEQYPHLYGPLNLDAIVGLEPF